MASTNRGARARTQRVNTPGRRRALLIGVAVAVLAVGIAGAVVFLRGGAGAGFGPLAGRWVRLDGGYVLDIRGVGADGRIDAVYLNPRPITVAKAEATRDGSSLKVFIELRAPGYPGSTYTLAYDPGTDQLEGVYYQAALQQRFDVQFVRTK